MDLLLLFFAFLLFSLVRISTVSSEHVNVDILLCPEDAVMLMYFFFGKCQQQLQPLAECATTFPPDCTSITTLHMNNATLTQVSSLPSSFLPCPSFPSPFYPCSNSTSVPFPVWLCIPRTVLSFNPLHLTQAPVPVSVPVPVFASPSAGQRVVFSSSGAR